MSRPELRLQGISYRDGEDKVDGIAHPLLPLIRFDYFYSVFCPDVLIKYAVG